jgi:hypothetical protein
MFIYNIYCTYFVRTCTYKETIPQFTNLIYTFSIKHTVIMYNTTYKQGKENSYVQLCYVHTYAVCMYAVHIHHTVCIVMFFCYYFMTLQYVHTISFCMYDVLYVHTVS